MGINGFGISGLPQAAARRPAAGLKLAREGHVVRPNSVASRAVSSSFQHRISDDDVKYIEEAAKLADSSAGLTQPHPNAACILVDPTGRPLTSAFQRAQGTTAAEVQAVSAAGSAAKGSTAYLNLETGDCHGEAAAVKALVQAGVSRVVMGMRHPLPHLRGQAAKALRAHGVCVDILGEVPVAADPAAAGAALRACLQVNEPLLHRAVLRRPFSVLKYAMTLDGKIATEMGHSAWVTSPPARALVFAMRARSDAVIVGGNTVRRDNPRLTTRREGGHMPVRVVMSRTLDLPEDAELWNVTSAPTIVMTQRGARQKFQAFLQSRGVEVVEFDFLTPENVADYCYERGFLQCFWECGGTLAAPCISGNVIHKVMAFVAPKIIGGCRAPTPVGGLGFVEMTQAVTLVETHWQQVGPDLMITGYLPSSGGVEVLEESLSGAGTSMNGSSTAAVAEPAAVAATTSSSTNGVVAAGAMLRGSSSSGSAATGLGPRMKLVGAAARNRAALSKKIAAFYKPWDLWGSLSNFSPHPIVVPEPAAAGAQAADDQAASSSSSSSREWQSVEHYYQASKFNRALPEAQLIVDAIAEAASPEEAARLGRFNERTRPHLMRPDWATAKIGIMLSALRAKFVRHEGPRKMLLDSAGFELVESSPHDMFWGQGYSRTGENHLGRLLMQVRDEMLASHKGAAAQQQSSSSSQQQSAAAGTLAGAGV